MKKRALILGLTLLAGTHLAGCNTPILSEEIRDRIAAPAWMVERHIPAGPFALTAFERMHTHDAPANIYIEGDGKAWVSRREISLDPTPVNPVGLHLASKDAAENLAYIARPCQYTKLLDTSKPCDSAYWTNRRFSPEVIDAYNEALDDIKARYDITGFNLIGYSGGGTVAALLAAQREDVLSLRTVAGNLDHQAHSAHHNVSYLDGSQNPPDYAARLSAVPQMHFIGGQDTIVPPLILESYLQALGPASPCVHYSLIQQASHDTGWVDKWPDLLKVMPTCTGSELRRIEVDFTGPPTFTGPYTSPERPDKP
jgi:dienelactone hydrolase